MKECRHGERIDWVGSNHGSPTEVRLCLLQERNAALVGALKAALAEFDAENPPDLSEGDPFWVRKARAALAEVESCEG